MRILSFLFLSLFTYLSIFSQSPEQIAHLDKYFEKSMESFQVPGMAIAIVKDGKLVFQKGYGMADLKSGKEVDEHTLFAIASNTKAFTASALAILVEEGKIDWQDRVIKYLPYFELYDPYVSKNMTIEDLLCHRSGLPTFSGDLLWYGSDKSSEEVVRSSRLLEATQDFRSTYGYSNVMYIAAGLIIEKVSGESWSHFIQEKILHPLHMNNTLSSTHELDKEENVATPYYLENGKNHALDWLNWDNVVAAGGLISSVNDMSKWLILNAQEGRLDSFQVFKKSSFRKMTTPHINFPVNSFWQKIHPSMHFRGYGLGWSLHDLYGKKVISHGGGYDGMISKTFIVPEEKLGMVILTNNLNNVPSILMEKTLDVLLGNKMNGNDYIEIYQAYIDQEEASKDSLLRQIERERGKINPHHLPLASYAGSYQDKMYGSIQVYMQDSALFFQMEATPIFQAKLEHWNDHIFTFEFPHDKTSLPPGKLWFHLDQNGHPEKLYLDIKNPDFNFLEFEFIRN